MQLSSNVSRSDERGRRPGSRPLWQAKSRTDGQDRLPRSSAQSCRLSVTADKTWIAGDRSPALDSSLHALLTRSCPPLRRLSRWNQSTRSEFPFKVSPKRRESQRSAPGQRVEEQSTPDRISLLITRLRSANKSLKLTIALVTDFAGQNPRPTLRSSPLRSDDEGALK